MIKKSAALLLAAWMLISFAACNPRPTETTAPPTSRGNTVLLPIDQTDASTYPASSERPTTDRVSDTDRSSETDPPAPTETNTSETVLPTDPPQTDTASETDRPGTDGPSDTRVTDPIIDPPTDTEPADTNTVSGSSETTDEPGTEDYGAELKNGIKTDSAHASLSEEAYFQYSTLNDAEKELYRRIVQAIRKGENVIDVRAWKVPSKVAEAVLEKVVADHPQYFWVSHSRMLSYDPRTQRAYSILLQYTDGESNDEYDETGKLTKTASRAVIDRQITEFNTAIDGFLSRIPLSLTEPEKERLIHDMVTEHLTYDREAANTFTSFDVLPRAFDAYGAVCRGSAVCEGYSKMFQYLCYCVGINACQVTGITDGGGHMWNCALIDGVWYHVDVTFDDGSASAPYFNVTKQYMLDKGRTIDSKIALPESE